VEGHWQETTRQVQGNLTGQIVDGDLEGGVVGPGFTAEISLRATGRRQIMSIMPQGGDVNHVIVVLRTQGGGTQRCAACEREICGFLSFST
jgi:hypothetical protein